MTSVARFKIRVKNTLYKATLKPGRSHVYQRDENESTSGVVCCGRVSSLNHILKSLRPPNSLYATPPVQNHCMPTGPLCQRHLPPEGEPITDCHPTSDTSEAITWWDTNTSRPKALTKGANHTITERWKRATRDWRKTNSGCQGTEASQGPSRIHHTCNWLLLDNRSLRWMYENRAIHTHTRMHARTSAVPTSSCLLAPPAQKRTTPSGIIKTISFYVTFPLLCPSCDLS